MTNKIVCQFYHYGENVEEVVVSICCITFNQELYISTAIESFLAQKTDFPFEIIISDDKSNDNTVGIIQEYVEKYPDLIKLNVNRENIGANANLLQAIKRARGKYIALCEGDDYWIDELKLQLQYETMLKNPQSLFCFHSCRLHKNSKLEEKVYFDKGGDVRLFGVDDILQDLKQFAPTASYMFARHLDQLLPDWFSAAPVGDLFLELYGMKNGGGVYIPRPMCAYRISSLGSWTETTQSKTNIHRKRHLEIIRFLKKSQIDFPLYKSAFDKKISHIYLSLAIRAVKNKDYIDFRRFIEQSICYNNEISISQKICNKLKSAPLMLYYLLCLKSVFSINQKKY
nr:glycosyltransferase [Escherichia coli]